MTFRPILRKLPQCKPHRRSCGDFDLKQYSNLPKVNYLGSICCDVGFFDGNLQAKSVAYRKTHRQRGVRRIEAEVEALPRSLITSGCEGWTV